MAQVCSIEEAKAASVGAAVVAIARSWLGTPYHHQMAVRQAGCDCLGLVRGVYAEFYGAPAEEAPPYSPDWAEATGTETLIDAAERHLVRVTTKGGRPYARDLAPGDVLIFRMNRKGPAKHAAILTALNCGAIGGDAMIHAFEHNPVCEVPMNGFWWARLAAGYRFPMGNPR
jgi:NlpC/P60 family putative phage cell wall peptidase